MYTTEEKIELLSHKLYTTAEALTRVLSTNSVESNEMIIDACFLTIESAKQEIINETT